MKTENYDKSDDQCKIVKVGKVIITKERNIYYTLQQLITNKIVMLNKGLLLSLYYIIIIYIV